MAGNSPITVFSFLELKVVLQSESAILFQKGCLADVKVWTKDIITTDAARQVHPSFIWVNAILDISRPVRSAPAFRLIKKAYIVDLSRGC